MSQNQIPDHTAVRVALWRAMHVQADAAPHVLEDQIGLQLVAPPDSWRDRPDMHPQGTRGYRASIVGRARFIEDLVEDHARHGVGQYVILGAGLDSFAQRRPDLMESLDVFEIDMPATQEWKRQRLQQLHLPCPPRLHFVPVDFEAGQSWLAQLDGAGFHRDRPAVIASTGVAMYLSREANLATLREVAGLARGTVLAMTFMLPTALVEPEDRPGYEMVQERARAAGTPFVSLFTPDEVLRLAREAGFKNVRHVSRAQIIQKYFAGRADGLKPSSGEEFLIATVD
jgi:methyltransferase (TIGR00027 family)